MDGMRLEHVSEFKYFGCVLNESGTEEAECRRKVANGREGCSYRSLVNDMGLHLECTRVLHETSLMLVFMYGSETMI